MIFIGHTWVLLAFGLLTWIVAPWLWLLLGLPYADMVAEEDPEMARRYEGIYRRALPKLRGLWLLGGSTAILAYALEASSWRRSDWVTATAVPCLRVVAAFLIGTAIAQALDLVFREVSIAVRLIQRDPGSSQRR